jgi:hypothetical protein
MFCKVLLNFWKDSEPEMSTITSSKTAIAAVARIYAKGIVDLLAFVFSILPLRPIVRILITAYLLTRTAWFLLGDAVPLPQTVLGSALVLAAALAIVEWFVNISMILAVEHTRWLIAQFRSATPHNNGHDERQALEEVGNQKLAQLFRNLGKMPGPVEDPDRWN